MFTTEAGVRGELLSASDETIENAVSYAEPMVLRGLLYLLTGDPEVAATEVTSIQNRTVQTNGLAHDEDVAMLRRKMVEFLKSYRDAGAGPIDVADDRVALSLDLVTGAEIRDHNRGLCLEELGLDPLVRSHKWGSPPDPERLANFTVTIVGAGMGGLNAALQLKRAGIPYTVIEKNPGVGGTWWENRYPGARVDTSTRSYTHLFGINFVQDNPYCTQAQNMKYFDWVADTFDLRNDITFNTEVLSMTWDEAAGEWEIKAKGPDGERVHRSNAVITAVGFLNRPNVPDFDGLAEFQGQSWHTAKWPVGMDLRDKRVAVIGTGATGYQLIPELASETRHLTVFQRTPHWVSGTKGYLSPHPWQVTWLDRNVPFHPNFLRFRGSYLPGYGRVIKIDPEFKDPHATSAANKAARDVCIEFLNGKLKNPALVAAMTPENPVGSSRSVTVDEDYSILDVLQHDNVDLVTSPIKRMNRTGIETADGVQHDVDVIVFATGFHATEYMYPMKITGRDGKSLDDYWAVGGARAYRSCMIPGFPNLWAVYGPNTNGALNVTSFHEMVMVYAMQLMERLILEGKKAVDVKEEPYWEYARQIDERNNRMVWSDPRTQSYYWSKHGRSVTQNPLNGVQMWRMLREPDFEHLDIR